MSTETWRKPRSIHVIRGRINYADDYLFNILAGWLGERRHGESKSRSRRFDGGATSARVNQPEPIIQLLPLIKRVLGAS